MSDVLAKISAAMIEGNLTDIISLTEQALKGGDDDHCRFFQRGAQGAK